MSINEPSDKILQDQNESEGLSPKVDHAKFIESLKLLGVLDNYPTKDTNSTEGFLIDFGIKSLRKEIVNIVETSQPITFGQEGEIYLIESGDGKNVLIAKKRYTPGLGENEYDMQGKAFQISKECGSSILVPQPIDFFISEDGRDEYITMEYVNGKTIYTMIWEKIVNQFLYPILKEHDRLTRECQDLIQSHGEDGIIKFKNDTDTDDTVKTILHVMFINGLIGENPDNAEYENGQKKFPNIEKIYKKYVGKVHLFNKEEGDKLRGELKVFLDSMHEEGLHHKDLGGNLRNIMYGEDGIISIIDYGKSSIESSEYDYSSAIEGGSYVDDNYILPLIESLSGELEEKNINDNNYGEIIEQGKERGIIINEGDIRIFMNIRANINHIKIYEDFVLGNDTAYNWFIYKKIGDNIEKNATERGIKRVFLMIQFMDDNEKLEFKTMLESELSINKKNSRKFYYSNLFLNLF